MSTIRRIYKDGTITRVATNEPVHTEGGGGNLTLSRKIPKNAVLIASDNPKAPGLVGSDKLLFRIMNKEDDFRGDALKNHGLMEMAGNLVIDASYDIYDTEGRTYEKSYEFKANGYIGLSGEEIDATYNVDVNIEIVIQRTFEGENLTGHRLVLNPTTTDMNLKNYHPVGEVGTGRILYVVHYKQLFNSGLFLQGVLDSNYYGAFDNETGNLVRINGTVFDTKDEFLEPIFSHRIEGDDVIISTSYRIGSLTKAELSYGNFYYDIQLMSSKHIVVKNWEYNVIVSEIQN
jgi:hypothetical protein